MKARIATLLAYASVLPVIGYALDPVVVKAGPQCCVYTGECSIGECCAVPEGTQPCSQDTPRYCRETSGGWCNS
jgi:hypothetical protein